MKMEGKRRRTERKKGSMSARVGGETRGRERERKEEILLLMLHDCDSRKADRETGDH